MLAERGIDVSYETVHRWTLKFGAIIARKLRRGRSGPDARWHLDEVFVSGRQLYCWMTTLGWRWRWYESLSISKRYMARLYRASALL